VLDTVRTLPLDARLCFVAERHSPETLARQMPVTDILRHTQNKFFLLFLHMRLTVVMTRREGKV
jgi:hypothetical protein